MSSLLESLVQTPGIQLGIAAAYPGWSDDHFSEAGVEYFVAGQPRFQSIFSCRKCDLDKCVDIVRRWKPDLVHIHGSERFYGLLAARKLIPMPCVISLQGLLQPYVSGFFGGLTVQEMWRSHRVVELATRRGLFWFYRQFCAGARQEKEILAESYAFMGRTDWDRAWALSANPAAKYYYVGEVLRRPFYETCWDVSRCERHTIIFTNAGEPRRGTEVLLRALLLVRREFPRARLRLAGQIGDRRGYDRHLQRMIDQNDLRGSVDLLGYLDGSAMAKALSRAHVFAISSYIENSPNSLCEAMQVGLPCVATYAGGIPSLVEHGRTGLLFPPGDAPLLADAIVRIFRDDDLAAQMGQAARAEASQRHAPKAVTSQLLHAYDDVLANGNYA
ncbi:MAG TPA: glycosyltransferase family 4 protein [Bryobacteraceae bacterium]|nr:glycosyltransferase family 4 protein [Bryobacteraceae bacterium]